jgi:hypothetical protein
MAAMFAQGSMGGSSKKADEGLMRHIILNSIRMYNHKFRKAYGSMVIACDGGSWRRQFFPEYKSSRRASKAENKSGTDWDEFYRIINTIRDELRENFPYKVLQCEYAEADDIIAVLTKHTQVDFGISDPVMIVSADHDFIQLQKYPNVRQFSPLKKKAVTDSRPQQYLNEHIIRGDVGDGVPNVLSPDNTFVAGTRQKPISAKKIQAWCQDDLSQMMQAEGDEVFRNFVRNRLMIDFEFIPKSIEDAILKADVEAVVPTRDKVFPFLVSKGCHNLVSSCADFF